MATTTKPVSTVPENPLAEGLAKVTGMDPLSSSAGTADLIAYDPNLAFRAPEGDVIQISGDPGSGASQAETWSHELALEQLRNQQLEFEYAQQQDLLEQAFQQQQFGLSQQQFGLSQTASNLAAQQQAASESQFSQNYALQQAEAQRAAAMSPYQIEGARLANEAATYANAEAARKAQDTANVQAAMAANAQYNLAATKGGYALGPGQSTAATPAVNPYTGGYTPPPKGSTYTGSPYALY